MKKNEAWIVTVDMGYGHQRAAYPLRHLSPSGKVLVANNYAGIPEKDQKIWRNSRKIYEWISRFKRIPIVGEWIFGLMNYLQRIPDFYPRRDLSKSILQLSSIYSWIRRKKWGQDMITYLNNIDSSLPFVTSFFITAFMAEEHGYKGDIYCLCCDADISRAWAPLDPKKSRIKYFAPCRRVYERLQLYGVRKENIILSGFPLPLENIGNKNLTVLKKDLVKRIERLDPCGNYREKYGQMLKKYFPDISMKAKNGKSAAPTLTFAVGGAGAQREIAYTILKSLRKSILEGKIKLNLVAGSRNDVYIYFKTAIKYLRLTKYLNKSVNIIYDVDKEDYFAKFNKALRDTDILWTKPSELVFYAALGIPIIMAPSVGSQEVFNRRWLKTIGAGITQGVPKYTNEWLFDWIKSGWLAEAAMSGFLDERQFGTYSIEDALFRGIKEPTKKYHLL